MLDRSNPLDRRTFLRNSLATPWAIGLGAESVAAENRKASPPDPSKIRNFVPEMKYRPVGNTDLYFSVLSMGGHTLNESVLLYAMDRGVNLIHTCLTYRNAQDTRILGKVLKSHRDRLFIACKDEFNHIDDLLRELGIDCIDFLMFNRHTRSAASEPKILDKIETYRRHGKIRYGGLTVHGDVARATAAGIESGMFTVVMPALTLPNFEAMDRELRLAHEKGVGVIGIKIAMGISEIPLQKAQIKKALQNPGITTYMKGMHSFEEFDYFYEAVQKSFTQGEERALRRYAEAGGSTLCRLCDECRRACPQGIQISPVLRCHDYYLKQLNEPERAAAEYHSIPSTQRWSGQCSQCRLCEAVCPEGRAIVERLNDARRQWDPTA